MGVQSIRAVVALSATFVVALMIVSGIPSAVAYTPAGPGTRAGEMILKVGGQDEMKSRNLLPAISNDVWTSDVIYRVYDSVLQGDPVIDQPLAYIAKGVDVNQNGIFENTEYNDWRKGAGTDPLNVTVYYDFNGVRWENGSQMDMWDLLFSYAINSMNPRFNTGLRVLLCGIGTSDTYDSCGRKLNIQIVDTDLVTPGYQKSWEGEANMFGGDQHPLRVALRYTLNQPFALFYTSSLAPVMLPMAEWSRLGNGHHPASDFGCAIWLPPSVANARKLSECGNANPATWGQGIALTDIVPGSHPFDYTSAEQWNVLDADVIGSGPFRGLVWDKTIEADVYRNDGYYTGREAGADGKFNTQDDIVYDARLSAKLQLPIIDGIRFRVFKTTQLGVFALQSGEIDYYHWNVPAEFVPDLLKVPEIAVESNAEPGFFYMSYNMRKEPWGYKNGDPSQGDVGLPFRQAMSYVVDKKGIVQNLLQNYGVVGNGVIAPTNTFWYNPNLRPSTYDIIQANAILNSPAAVAAGISADPGGPCSKDTPSGCRFLGRLGQNYFELIAPQADYDPVRASACISITDAMRQVGVNVGCRPTAFGQIVNLITARTFDIFILGWRIGGTDPDFLFDFFDSSNAGTGGQNHPGFNNATFDQVIEDSRAELNRTHRRELIFQAQQILADTRPYEVLYFRTNIEGYRQDRFVDWKVSSGTIWGFWSLETIHPPSTKAMRESITMESAASSNDSVPVTVTVFDDHGAALPSASVNITVPGNSGNMTIGTACVQQPSCVATTNINGQVRGVFGAPGVTSQTGVLIKATASHPDFPQSTSRTTAIQIFPPGVKFLSLLLDLLYGDRVTSGESLPLKLQVHDQDHTLVSDANVKVIVSDPTKLTPDRDNGTSGDITTVTFTAATVAVDTPLNVTIKALKPGFNQAGSVFLVTVASPPGGTHRCLDGTLKRMDEQCPTVNTPGLDVVFILAGIGIAAVVAGVIAERRRRS